MGQRQDELPLPHQIYLNQAGIGTQHFILFLKIFFLTDSTDLFVGLYPEHNRLKPRQAGKYGCIRPERRARALRD